MSCSMTLYKNMLSIYTVRHNGHLLQTTYEQSHPDMVCRTMEVIGAYISWIDIGLIANERFVGVLLKFMSNPLLRESACDCICEIIVKGMEPLAKVELIQSFMSVLQGAGIFNVSEVKLFV